MCIRINDTCQGINTVFEQSGSHYMIRLHMVQLVSFPVAKHAFNVITVGSMKTLRMVLITTFAKGKGTQSVM